MLQRSVAQCPTAQFVTVKGVGYVWDYLTGWFVGIGAGVFTGLALQPALGFHAQHRPGYSASDAAHLVGGRSQFLGRPHFSIIPADF